MSTERLHANGPNGEATIVERTTGSINTSNLDGPSTLARLPSYRLGTGERLNPTDHPNVFQSLDGTRRYTLR